MHLMRRGEVKQYAFTPQGWAMEYARGALTETERRDRLTGFGHQA